MFVAAPGGKGRIKNCSSDAWWKMWEHAVMLTWMIFLVPFCPKDSSHTVCVLTKLTEESVTRYLCEQHARREWIQLVQCLWMNSAGTVFMNEFSWYRVYEWIQLVQCLWMNSAGTVFMNEFSWYSVYEWIQLVQCLWMNSAGTVFMNEFSWYSVYEWIQLVQCLWVRRYSVPTCTARVIEIFHKRKVSGSSRT